MAIRKSSSSGIPFGNTAGRPANPGLGQLYSNGQAARLELYTATGWQNIIQETPGVASASGTYNEATGSGTFIVSGTNFVDGAIAYAVGTNGTEYQAASTTYNSLVQLTTVFSSLSPAYEPYDIKITNPSNLFGLLPDAFYINDSPVWSTSSGSLGSFTGAISIQLAATDDESNTITYTVTSGSLPAGLSLSSSGLISGTATYFGTTTFTVSASDGSNTAVTRSFSLITYPTITGGTVTISGIYRIHAFTSSGTFAKNTSSSLDVEYLLVGGGGAGGDDIGAGGGAGGVLSGSLTLSSQSNVIVVGGGGAATLGFEASGQGIDGNNSTAFGLTAFKGGAGGGEGSSNANGGSGTYGSGGGGGYSAGSGGSGTSGQGNSGGNGASGNAGGGGGAGGSGSAGGPGHGGPGILNSILGTSYYWGGGGGGNSYNYSISGDGGIGGGGGGSTATNLGTTGAGAGGGSALNNGAAGIHAGGKGGDGGANTGGGGGGSKESNANQLSTSGAGGSGIFIVRYLKSVVGL
jgi:hypothetical protein